MGSLTRVGSAALVVMGLWNPVFIWYICYEHLLRYMVQVFGSSLRSQVKTFKISVFQSISNQYFPQQVLLSGLRNNIQIQLLSAAN